VLSEGTLSIFAALNSAPATSNGEIERPPRSTAGASIACRSSGVLSALLDHGSRTAPMIVRSHPPGWHCARAAPELQVRRHSLPVERAPEASRTRCAPGEHRHRRDCCTHRSHLGARPDLNSRCRQPHAHGDASNEDACGTTESARARAPMPSIEGARLFFAAPKSPRSDF
jgi:hypothetical protein